MLQILNKLKHLFKRSVTTNTQQDGNQFYNVTVRYFGKDSVSEVWWPYGMYANPPVNSRGFTLNVLGQEEDQVSLLYSPQYRFIGLAEGETQFGNPKVETYIKFLNNGTIEIKTNNEVIINGGDLSAPDGDISDDSGSTPSMQDMRDVFNTHTHTGSGNPPNEQM